MKTNTIQTILLLVIVLLFFTGCDAPVFPETIKDDFPSDVLPEETQIGVRRVGCLVNGEVYTNVKKIRVTARYDYSVPGQEEYYIHVEFPETSEMYLTIYPPFQENDTLTNGWIYFLGIREKDGSRYRFTDKKNVKVYLTKLDTINKILSGNFTGSPRMYDNRYNPLDSILYITEGRFDVIYQ